MVPEVTAQLRPRTGWESQDLGLALVRGQLGALLWQWLVVLGPMWIGLGWALRYHPGWFLFLTWWLKPLYDRLPLFTLSRRLFGQETRLRDVLRAWPKLWLKGNWWFLTLGRFSFYRSFAMPIKVLEGATHRTYRRRLRLLLRQEGDSTMIWISLGWLLISLLVTLACWSLWSSLSVNLESDDSSPVWWQIFSNRGPQIDLSTWWTFAILHLVGMTLTEFWYLGGGFGLYLNSRSHLEGWDIEVSFRSLAARLAEITGRAVIVIVLGLGLSQMPAAQPAEALTEQTLSQAEIEQRVKDIKAAPDFKVLSEEHTVYDDVSGPDWNWGFPDLSWLGSLMQFVVWLGLVGLIVFLLWKLYEHRGAFRFRPGPPVPEVALSKARVVLGMEVTPESLPANIPAAAAVCWQAGDVRGALRLLYAGSLHWMIQRAHLPIQESDTEGDCLRHSQALPIPPQQYFSSLTQTWMEHAYGYRIPATSTMEQLLAQWPFGG